MSEIQGPVRGRRGRILLEGVVIVLSILLAFAIDAGWDERQERRAEQEILQALSAEFETYKEGFNDRAEFYDHMSESIVWLLDEAEFLPSEVERLDQALLAFVGVPTLETGSGVHAELVASGRVSLISDLTLRRLVSTWQGLLAETTDNEVAVRQYATEVLIPYLASRGMPIGRASRIPRQSDWRLAVASEAEALAAYRMLVSDDEFRTLATWRYEWALGSARDFRWAAATADTALVRVRASRGN